MRPKTNAVKITKQELESIVIPSGTNKVLVHIPHRNENTKTESGVYVVGDQDYKPQYHAERWGYIYKLPPHLVFDIGVKDTLAWQTEMEAEIGDKVWFDYREPLYAPTYEVDGEWYKLINYGSLYVVKRGDKIIPLNGYILMEAYEKDYNTFLKTLPTQDKRFGLVSYVGSKNKKYMLDVFNDDIDIEQGDHVLFESGTACFELENELHATFSDEPILLQQRKRVIAVVDDAHTRVIRTRRGVVAGLPRKKTETKSGIQLVSNKNQNYDVVDVVTSTHDSIKKGAVVLTAKGKGVEFNKLRYFTEDMIFYYEN